MMLRSGMGAPLCLQRSVPAAGIASPINRRGSRGVRCCNVGRHKESSRVLLHANNVLATGNPARVDDLVQGQGSLQGAREGGADEDPERTIGAKKDRGEAAGGRQQERGTSSCVFAHAVRFPGSCPSVVGCCWMFSTIAAAATADLRKTVLEKRIWFALLTGLLAFPDLQQVRRTLASKKQERQQERDLLSQGIMPDSLKDWKPYRNKRDEEANSGIVVPLLPFGNQ
eukprot:scaffold122628_cov16-Tisochrysis_lutea.AAC.1